MNDGMTQDEYPGFAPAPEAAKPLPRGRFTRTAAQLAHQFHGYSGWKNPVPAKEWEAFTRDITELPPHKFRAYLRMTGAL